MAKQYFERSKLIRNVHDLLNIKPHLTVHFLQYISVKNPRHSKRFIKATHPPGSENYLPFSNTYKCKV